MRQNRGPFNPAHGRDCQPLQPLIACAQMPLHRFDVASDHGQELLKSCATPPVSWPIASIF